MCGDVCVLNSQYLVDVLALDPFCDDGRGCNGGSTAECFEFRLLDVTIVVNLDLELLKR